MCKTLLSGRIPFGDLLTNIQDCYHQQNISRALLYEFVHSVSNMSEN